MSTQPIDVRGEMRGGDPALLATVPSVAALRESVTGRPLAELRAELEAMGPPEPDESIVPPLETLLVPERFRAATFKNYVPTTPSQHAALAAVGQWCKDVMAGTGPMLALIGTTGTGKSHLLYAAVRHLVRRNYPVYARAWYKLADEMRYGGPSAYGGTELLEAKEVRAQLFGRRIVLLDEIRATASTAFDDTELTKFTADAWDRKSAVLITTNVSPLADVMGPPAASRFERQVTIIGPDHRQSLESLALSRSA